MYMYCLPLVSELAKSLLYMQRPFFIVSAYSERLVSHSSSRIVFPKNLSWMSCSFGIVVLCQSRVQEPSHKYL